MFLYVLVLTKRRPSSSMNEPEYYNSMLDLDQQNDELLTIEPPPRVRYHLIKLYLFTKIIAIVKI